MNSNNKSQKGQALILIAVGLVGLISMVALAIDAGNAFSDRRMAQNAADNSAMAAALAYSDNFDRSNPINSLPASLSAATTSATNLAAINGYGDSSLVNYDIIATPNGACNYGGYDFYADISSQVNTYFAKIVGIDSITNHVNAISRVCNPTSSGPSFPGGSVIGTHIGSCSGNHPSIGETGDGHLQVWGGDLISYSSDSGCVLFKNGDTIMKKLEGDSTCGDIVTAANDGNVNSVTWEDSCGSFLEGVPPATLPDDIDMTGNCGPDRTNADNIPGTYNGDFPPTGNITLQPGLYCLNGDFILNANNIFDATGVTIYLQGVNSNIRWNGNMQMTLKAAYPQSNPDLYNSVDNLKAIAAGAIPGLAIYAPQANQNVMEFNGTGNWIMQGTILMSGADCSYAGTSENVRQKIQFICEYWSMNGTSSLELEYDQDVLYSPDIIYDISMIK